MTLPAIRARTLNELRAEEAALVKQEKDAA